MNSISEDFVAGVFFAIMQRKATNNELMSITSSARNVRDVFSMIRNHPEAIKFFNSFYGLSYSWVYHNLCFGEGPSFIQAELLAEVGVNCFIDVTDKNFSYKEYLNDNIRYSKFPLKNDQHNDLENVEEVVVEVFDRLNNLDKVYLHCESGISRSALITTLVVALKNRIDYDTALDLLKKKRSAICPHKDLLLRTEIESLLDSLKDKV